MSDAGYGSWRRRDAISFGKIFKESFKKIFRERAHTPRGQISFEYVAGFVLFIFVVIFVAFSAISGAQSYYKNPTKNNLYAEAWSFSQNILYGSSSRADNANGSLYTLDSSKLEFLTGCTEYNRLNATAVAAYESIRTKYEINAKRDWRITLEENAIGLAETKRDSNWTGNLSIDGYIVRVEIFNTSAIYDRVRINSSAALVEGNGIILNQKNFTVSKISTDGNWVILTRRIADCGKTPPLSSTLIETKRFAMLDNELAVLRLEYW